MNSVCVRSNAIKNMFFSFLITRLLLLLLLRQKLPRRQTKGNVRIIEWFDLEKETKEKTPINRKKKKIQTVSNVLFKIKTLKISFATMKIGPKSKPTKSNIFKTKWLSLSIIYYFLCITTAMSKFSSFLHYFSIPVIFFAILL